MRTFIMHVQSATQHECIADTTSFVGEDKSGSFGILAHHERMMTILTYGLAQYQLFDGKWRYLALPGGLLYFVNNTLYISTRRFFKDTDYERIRTELMEQLLAEEAELSGIKENLYNLEQEMFRHLWQMGRKGVKL